MVFSLLFVYNRISDRIKKTINEWDDRIKVDTISFEIDADHSLVNILLRFSIKGYDNIFEHSVNMTGV